MGVVNAHQGRQQQLFGVLEVVVQDVADVFRRKTHLSQYIPFGNALARPPSVKHGVTL
jgi:hypothetical protein